MLGVRRNTLDVRPPGPAGDRLTGNLAAFSADPLTFLTDCARTYGDVVSLGERNVLIADPTDIERVLIDRNGDFAKLGDQTRKRGRRRGFPTAMMNSDGTDWQVKRRRVQPAFGRHLAELAPAVVTEETRRMIADWKPGEQRDLHQEVSRVTLRTVTRLMFGFLPGERDVAAVGRLIDAVMDLSLSPLTLPAWVPTPLNVRLHRATRAMDRVLGDIVANPRGSDRRRAPVLHALLSGTPAPSPNEVRDELATLVMSGYETTNCAVIWTCCLLARHPEIAARVAAEAADACSEGDVSLERLNFTHAVVREALRLYPPGWLTSRESLRETKFQGYSVPAGTTVTVSQWVTHRDPRFYDRPTDFSPNRWLHDRPQDLPRGAYFPFGLGPRACIGASIALTEIVLIVATIWQRFRLALPGEASVRPRPALALQPENATVRLLPAADGR
jgi:cytochrome P450